MLKSSNWLATLAQAAVSALLAWGPGACSPGASAVVAAPRGARQGPAPSAGGPERAAPLSVTSRLDGKNYRCNLVVGPSSATAWFDAGFERLVPDERWEALSGNEAFLATLGDPGARTWSRPVRSPCAQRADAPERVLVFAVAEKHTSRDDWLTELMALVNAVRARYPSAREIQLSPAVSGSKPCAGPLEDAESSAHAIERVTQQFDGLVQPGPRIRIDDCESFEAGRPQLTPVGNERAARLFAEYYAGDF